MLRKPRISIPIVAIALFGACSDDDDKITPPTQPPVVLPPVTPGTATTGCQRVALVADQPGIAPTTDPNLVNPWGLATAPGAFWIADNGTGFLSAFDGTGAAAAANDQIMLEEGIDGIVAN